ncbi:DinB family protein [Anaerolineales bacterium HSG6]|nr:DinB family protein [Anaerolineales bacterium HSG6]MDM8531757.1 DinB family protein [Anaerolineales bacterium HSG25]
MSDKKTTIKQYLSKNKTELVSYLETLTPEQWEQEVFSEGNQWTVRDIITHLVEAETGLSIQIHKIRAGRETLPQGFDLDRWNAGVKKRMGDLTPAQLLQGLEEVRQKTLERLKTIESHEWELSGEHPSFGVVSVEKYYQIIAGHQRQHLIDIQSALT